MTYLLLAMAMTLENKMHLRRSDRQCCQSQSQIPCVGNKGMRAVAPTVAVAQTNTALAQL